MPVGVLRRPFARSGAGGSKVGLRRCFGRRVPSWLQLDDLIPSKHFSTVISSVFIWLEHLLVHSWDCVCTMDLHIILLVHVQTVIERVEMMIQRPKWIKGSPRWPVIFCAVGFSIFALVNEQKGKMCLNIIFDSH